MISNLAFRRSSLAWVGLLAAGCASGAVSSETRSDLAARAVEISNHNWATAAVYAVRDGVRARIGTVETGQTAVLRLPWDPTLGQVQLLIHPIGGRENYLSPILPQVWGGRLTMSVENQLSLSYVTVR